MKGVVCRVLSRAPSPLGGGESTRTSTSPRVGNAPGRRAATRRLYIGCADFTPSANLHAHTADAGGGKILCRRAQHRGRGQDSRVFLCTHPHHPREFVYPFRTSSINYTPTTLATIRSRLLLYVRVCAVGLYLCNVTVYATSPHPKTRFSCGVGSDQPVAGRDHRVHVPSRDGQRRKSLRPTLRVAQAEVEDLEAVRSVAHSAAAANDE